MGLVIALIWLVGMLVTVGVERSRIGMSQWGVVPLFTIMRSLPWFLTNSAIIPFWPVALVIWLARGRPDTPWELVESPRDGTLTVKRRR